MDLSGCDDVPDQPKDLGSDNSGFVDPIGESQPQNILPSDSHDGDERSAVVCDVVEENAFAAANVEKEFTTLVEGKLEGEHTPAETETVDLQNSESDAFDVAIASESAPVDDKNNTIELLKFSPLKSDNDLEEPLETVCKSEGDINSNDFSESDRLNVPKSQSKDTDVSDKVCCSLSAGSYSDHRGEANSDLENEEHNIKSPKSAVASVLNDSYEEKSCLLSPEIQRINDNDSIANSTRDGSNALFLDNSTDDTNNHDKDLHKKTTEFVEDTKGVETTEQDKDDEKEKSLEKSNVKVSAPLRHRSQRVSASSSSSCPCCIESTKPSPKHNSDPPPVQQPSPIPVVMESPRLKNPTREKYPVSETDPLAKPFLMGWRRELVYRGVTDYSKNKKQACDVYYFTPKGGKLRSLPEIVRYINENPDTGLEASNFTFKKELIYIAPYESERAAHLKSGYTPETKKEKVVQNKKESVQLLSPVETSGKRNRKPKVFADFVSAVSTPLVQVSPSEQDGVKPVSKISMRLDDMGNTESEKNVVVSRSGRRIKARSLEIVEQMPSPYIKKETVEPIENGNATEENTDITLSLESTKSSAAKDPSSHNRSTTPDRPKRTSTGSDISKPKADAVTSPERPKRMAVKRIHYEELMDIDEITDEEFPPVSSKKPLKLTPKLSPPEAENTKGKENTPNTVAEKAETAAPLASPTGKGPKINFTFSKFSKRVLNVAGNDTTPSPHDGASVKKRPKKSENTRVLNDRLCSLSCPGRKCSLPTLHCDVCLCLFHPECVGFLKAPKAFTCNWCKKESGQKVESIIMNNDEKTMDSVVAPEVPLPPKVPKIGTDEPEENDIASDDDPEFLPAPPDIVFSQQINQHVPVVPGLAFMRPPPPLIRAPIVQNNVLMCPSSSSTPSTSPTAPAQIVPPYGIASNTLRTMANLAQAIPQPAVDASSPPPPMMLGRTSPNALANGPRPAAIPGSMPPNPLQVTVPGMTKGTLIYTNNPNLRFILTPNVSPSVTKMPGPIPSQVGESKTSPTQGGVSPSTADGDSSASVLKAVAPLAKSPTCEFTKESKPPPSPPPSMHDPEPIVIDVKETSLCDMMLKIKIPDPASGMKKADIIFKKPEVREKGQPLSKTKKGGRKKGILTKKGTSATEEQPVVTQTVSENSEASVAVFSSDEQAVANFKDMEKELEVEPVVSGHEGPDTTETLLDSNTVETLDESSKVEPSEAMDVETEDGHLAVTASQSGVSETKDSPQIESEKSCEESRVSVASASDERLEPKDSENEDIPMSPLPADFLNDGDSDDDSVKSDCEMIQTPQSPVILKEVNYVGKSARIVNTYLSNRGAQLTSPARNCARTLQYKRTKIDTGWSEEHTYSFSPKHPRLSSNRKTVMTLNMPRHSFYTLQSASDSLHLVFEYLTTQDLLRASQVCRSWRKLAMQPHLWKMVKLKGMSITDWASCAKKLDRVKTTYLDLRGMKCKEDMWNQFVGTLHHLGNIEEMVFGEVPAFVLTILASSLTKLQCLEAEYIYTDVKRLPFWDPGCVSSLQKLSILRLRAPKGLELPRFLLHGGYYALSHLYYLTHLSLTSYRNSKSADFEFLEKMPQLEVLELGSCQDWDETAYKRLVKLKSLCRLRLELGGSAADRGLPNALTYLSKMEELTLIYFKITSSLAAAIRRLRNLWHLTLWPDMSSEGGLIVYNTLQAVRSLKKLQSFSWGIIYEDSSNTKYSRHTSKYRESAEVDEWWSEELRKTPHARGIRVPLLKALSEGGSKQQESKNEMQQGLIGVGHLHHKLKRVLPETDIYIYQVPESLLTKVYGTLR